MDKWRDCTLGDLLEIKHGYAFLGEYFGDTGTHIVLTPGNFFDAGGFKAKGDKEKWYSGPIPSDYVLNEGDVLIAMTEQAEGLLGSSAIIPRSGIYLHNQRLGLVQVRDRRATDKHFLYYLFNHKPVRQQIRGSASGTKIRHTAPSRICQVKVRVPPPAVQRRIVGILSAYDKLMENCQQRIRLLEEMARALYGEWFVLFRFPGHEKVPRVDSPLGRIPQGWDVKLLGDIVELNYGKSLKKETRCEGQVPVFGSSGIIGYHDTSLVKGPGIIVGRKGNVGSVFWSDEDFYVIDTAYFVTSSLPLRFLFYELPTKNFINSDAAVPGLSRHQAYSLETIVPPSNLLSRFCGLADHFERQASTLRRKIQNLRRTRDLLLPRLLSGQVSLDVSAVEDVAEPTAPAPPLSQTDFASEEPALRAAEEAPTYRAGRADFRAKGAASYQPGATPQEPPAPRASAESANHLATQAHADELPLQGSNRFSSIPGALPQAGDEVAPLALQTGGDEDAPSVRHGHAVAPVPRPADEAPVPIDQIDRTEVLQVIRQVFSEGPPRERDAAIRDVARALGYRRTGARIHEILHTDLLTAVRRGILENTGGELRLLTHSITDYERDFLKQQFLAAIGRPWSDRDTATRDFCRWLGFARTGPVIEDTARSLINGLLRDGRLEAEGAEMIRRTTR